MRYNSAVARNGPFGCITVHANPSWHYVILETARQAYEANSLSSPFASFRSRVSNPSVNHP